MANPCPVGTFDNSLPIHRWVLILIGVGILLMGVLIEANAQLYEHPFNFHQLQTGGVSVGAGTEFVAEKVAFIGTLEYGVLPHVEGFFKGGRLFFEDRNRSTRSPISFFYAGLSSTGPLGQSGLNYLGSASFFASFANEKTGVENRTWGLSGGLGILRRIPIDSRLTLAPYVALFYDRSWWTLDEETLPGSAFSGQIGVEVSLSTKGSVLGSLIYPVKGDRSPLYGVFLSFHPSILPFFRQQRM